MSLCVPFSLISLGSAVQFPTVRGKKIFAHKDLVMGWHSTVMPFTLVLSKTTNHPAVYQKRFYCLTDLTMLKWQLYSTHHHNSVENSIFHVVAFIYFV